MTTLNWRNEKIPGMWGGDTIRVLYDNDGDHYALRYDCDKRHWALSICVKGPKCIRNGQWKDYTVNNVPVIFLDLEGAEFYCLYLKVEGLALADRITW